MLIWGWKPRSKRLAEAEFHCPGCGVDRHYHDKQARRWFTIFFIPFIPLKVLGEYVECQTCQKGYQMSDVGAGGGGTAATRAALDGMAAQLGMTQAHARGVIDHPVESASS
jgi:hypothetical protein